MWTDATQLRDFYASGLGKVARRMIGLRIRSVWPDVRGYTVLGLGYAVPFLGVFRPEAGRIVALMPAGQGVLPWPAEGRSVTALAEEADLPLPDRSVDRVLLVHAMECAEQLRPMLRELWRVMSDGGRMLVVVPNRRGLWARFERTPFGHGRPFTPGQLAASLRDGLFAPYRTESALFVPPIPSRLILSTAPACEKVGRRWFAGFAGVVMVEATKEIYAGRFNFGRETQRAYAPLASR
ncbi:MAG: methyltransferase domain-containing protein [Rhodospirillales bacterium]|nr:MAG: methyltransferase domain-containing protein [Rhodospirillales bacterium]